MQTTTITELETALKDCQSALQEAELRLTKREESISKLTLDKESVQGINPIRICLPTPECDSDRDTPLIAPRGVPFNGTDTNNASYLTTPLLPSQIVDRRVKDLQENLRTLQVVVTPLEKRLVARHTKTSLLRLKNSPAKDPTRGRACMLVDKTNLKDNKNIIMGKKGDIVKRKIKDVEEDYMVDLNVSKKRRISGTKGNQITKAKVAKPRLSQSKARRRSGARYNLRRK